MGLLFKSDQVNQIILFWRVRGENQPQVMSSKVWLLDNMHILYRFSCKMERLGTCFIGAEHWLMPLKPAVAVSWRTFVSSWHDCRTQFIIAVIIPVFPAVFLSTVPNTQRRQKGKTDAPLTLDAIGLGAPAVQQCCRRLNTIGWLVSGQDAGSRWAHEREIPAAPQRRWYGKCSNMERERWSEGGAFFDPLWASLIRLLLWEVRSLTQWGAEILIWNSR